MPKERSPNRLKSEVGDKDRDNSPRQQIHDASPLEQSPVSDSKRDNKDASDMLARKTNGHGKRTNRFNPTAVPRYHQHDDRRTAPRDGRRSGCRSSSECGWWKDARDEDRAAPRSPSDPKVGEEKSRAQGGDNHDWRHDRFLEAEASAHPCTKKRRPFREEKLPLESEAVNNAVLDPSKLVHPTSLNGGIGRYEERARDRRPLERNEHDRAYARERLFSNQGRVENSGFPPRYSFTGFHNDGKFKGRQNFSGRQGYRSNGARFEKWKHDLYDEANRSPSPKEEEDPVAKVEALLAL